MIRIGVLGAARINRAALFDPARSTDGVEVFALTARDPLRAQAQAAKFKIPKVHPTYESLLSDPQINAVYIPLPTALHGGWAFRALDHGKHVLVEKPFAANATEAEEMRTAARTARLVIAEAHHTSYHPFTLRVRETIHSGVLGKIRSAKSWFHVPIPPGRDFRWSSPLGGGSLMDLGCYPVRMISDVLGPATVISATAKRRGDIDRRMTARLDVGGIPVAVDCGMWSSGILGFGLRVEGSRAAMRVRFPFHPQMGGRISVSGPGVNIREDADRKSSYQFQLEGFRDEVLQADGAQSRLAEAIRTMAVIDEIYVAAGMSPRQPFEI